MKKQLFKSFIAFAILFFSSYAFAQQEHVGSWIGESKGRTNKMILEANNHAAFIIDGQVLGGGNFEKDGRKMECIYEINYDKNPMWLDIVILDFETKTEIARLKGILRFIDQDKIEYRVSFDNKKRYTKFNGKSDGDTIILDRLKE